MKMTTKMKTKTTKTTKTQPEPHVAEARAAKKAQRDAARRQQALTVQGIVATRKASKKALDAAGAEDGASPTPPGQEFHTEPHMTPRVVSGAEEVAAQQSAPSEVKAKAKAKAAGVNAAGIPLRFSESRWYGRATLAAPGVRVMLPKPGSWTEKVWDDLESGLSVNATAERCPVDADGLMTPAARSFYRRSVRREADYMRAAGFNPACPEDATVPATPPVPENTPA